MSDIVNFSKQKFCSNVIEKCLEYNSKEVNRSMVDCIKSRPEEYFNLLSD